MRRPTERHEAPPRVAIYARYSTDSQNPRSVGDQVKLCQHWIERQGWPPAPEQDLFADRGISGGVTQREAYQELLTRIAGSNGRPAYDLVVVEDLSRLTREMLETTRLIAMAPIWGVRIVGVSDGQDSTLPGWQYTMAYRGISNAQYLEDLHNRIRRGLAGRFADSYHAGGSIFGFRTVPVPTPSGRLDRWGNPILAGHKLEVRSDQATVIKRVFQEAVSGMSCREIALALTREGVRKPSSEYGFKNEKNAARGKGHWNPQTVRSILTNERYRGLWRWQKTACVGKDPATGKKIMRPAEEVHEQQREDLRLVEDRVWSQVQERLAARGEGVKRDPKTGHLAGREKGYTPEFVYGHLMNPLNGLLKCAECGGPFNVIQTKAGKDGRLVRYLGCNTRHHLNARCSNAGVFRLSDLEAALGEALEGYFSDARLAARTLREFQRRLQAHRQRLTADEANAKQDQAEAEAEIAKVKDAILRGVIGETTATMLREAEAKRRAAQERLAAAEEARLTEPQPILPQEALAGLRAQHHRERRAAYQRLLDRVRLRSERGPGRKMVKRWVAEIVPKPEAAFKGLPKAVAFGKDFITVGGSPSGKGARRACGGG